jgi:hypothetical protein
MRLPSKEEHVAGWPLRISCRRCLGCAVQPTSAVGKESEEHGNSSRYTMRMHAYACHATAHSCKPPNDCTGGWTRVVDVSLAACPISVQHIHFVVYIAKHNITYKASNTVSQRHNSATARASNPRTANKQQYRGSSYSIASSVGTASPARKPPPLTRANMAPLA